MLFDYLDPNNPDSLKMFFASKKIFSNIDVVAARITESHANSVTSNVNQLRVDTTKK